MVTHWEFQFVVPCDFHSRQSHVYGLQMSVLYYSVSEWNGIVLTLYEVVIGVIVIICDAVIVEGVEVFCCARLSSTGSSNCLA